MNHLSLRRPVFARIFLLSILLGFAALDRAQATVVVSANLTQTVAGTPNTYAITLNNTSTASEAVSTFWFAWIPGQDFLKTSPTNIKAPKGWTFSITGGTSGDGYAIRFTTASAPLAAGGVLTGFSFQSPDSQLDLTGKATFHPTTPVLTSVVFTGGGSVETTFVATFQAELVIFGDSLSDVGNFYSAGLDTDLGGKLAPPDYTVGRFTDGADTTPKTAVLGVWDEQLSKTLGLPAPVASCAGGGNYAFGGAETGTLTVPPGTAVQVAQFLKDFPKPSPSAIYVLWGGSNDLLNATSLSGLATAETTAIANLKAQITLLAKAGAKHFVWFNLPQIGSTPVGAPEAAALNAACTQFKSDWSAAIPQLEAANSGITITGIDINTLFAQVAASPATYHLTNVTGVPVGVATDNPDKFLFWDGLHPTTVVHGIVANQVLSQLPTFTQTITFAAIPNQVFGAAPITLGATATSGLTVTYQATGPATISENVLTITGVGTVSVTASQTGNASYSAAPAVKQTFTVGKRSQTITFPAIANQAYKGVPIKITLAATASSGLAVTYKATGPATVAGSVLTINGAGTVTVTASQTGNTTYLAATAVGKSFTVSKSAQTITFPAIGNKTFTGTPIKIALKATASSKLAVSYKVTGPATLSLTTLTITGTGTVTVTAAQTGSVNYNAAAPVKQTVIVSP